MIYLLHQAVDRAAERDPERCAFRTPAAGLNYGELARKTNQLARLLRDQGVRPGDRVGILMPRCLETALAVHGILKAGAAYVPIDPHAPPLAVQSLIEVCGIAHVVTHVTSAARLTELLGPTRLCSVIGSDEAIPAAESSPPWSALDAQPDRGLGVARTSDDLAYIIFSSGSTGRPKGIVHTHASGLAYAAMAASVYDVQPEDRIGSLAPLHFDQSTFGYFSGPYAGATTVITPEAYARMPASLSQLLEKEAVTIWYSVPLALVQMLLRGALESRDLSNLRWVLYGGEPFPPTRLEALRMLWPQARFSNVYGPAEVNQCTFYHVPPGELGASIPIGRVWENAEGLVVDPAGNSVAPGESGELLIRSPTMMRGYWDRPDLNARAFYRRATPAGDDLFYRTGDLVRERPDGELEFLGRQDRQLKIRGHRVELDDVELALQAHPAVAEAAAFSTRRAATGEDEGAAIEAAVTVQSESSVTAEELTAFVAERLAAYAVPKRIEILPSLPRTATDKIDRRRLQLEAEEETIA